MRQHFPQIFNMKMNCEIHEIYCIPIFDRIVHKPDAMLLFFGTLSPSK